MTTIRVADDDTDVRVLLGCSAPMRELAGQVESMARSDATILLVGETGVGKSRIARMLHALSSRAMRPFREVECALRPEALLEMTLFGADQHAGMPAVPGVLEPARGGTVYLEEIADLPVVLQPQLLRVLDSPSSTALDATTADVRVIASSGRDLATEVTEDRFNEALYYRLGVTPLHLSPLRARAPEDLRETTLALLAELRRGLPDAPREITARAADLLARYHWPGNIRELRNVLERALLHAGGAIAVDVQHLPPEVLDASDGVAHAHISRTLAEVERTHIERTLRAHAANRTRAARELGISRATLIKKIREYGLATRHAGDLTGTQESA